MATDNVSTHEVLFIPLTGRCGDRRVLRGWTRVANDQFGQSLTEFNWCNSHGYVVRSVAERLVMIHRLVFQHYHGPIPAKQEIDHIDRDKRNNLPTNLRAVSRTLNNVNRNRRKDNVTGFVGVHKHCHGLWQAEIGVRNKRFYLGYFATPTEAAAAVNRAYAEHYPDIPPPNQNL